MKSQDNTPKGLLKYFFNFVNFDIKMLSQDNLPLLAMAYVRFAFFKDERASSEKYSALTSAAFDSSGCVMDKTKEFLENLQQYFRGILDQIIKSSDSGLSLEQRGVRLVKIVDGEFVETFMTTPPQMDEFNLKLEKQYAEASLTDIIINEDLVPQMFNRCEECSTYFYQKTKRTMKFCSQRCSNANRQRNFQKTQYLKSEQDKTIGIGVGP